MTKPSSGSAGAKSKKLEGKSASVGVQADADRKQDVAGVETDESQVDDREEIDAEGVEPAKAKRGIVRLRGRGVQRRAAGSPSEPRRGGAKAASGGSDDESEETQEETLDGDATESSEDLTDTQVSEETAADAAASDEDDDGAEADSQVSLETVAAAEDSEEGDDAKAVEPTKSERRIDWTRVVVYGLLPGLALLLTGAAGFFKWQDSSEREAQVARIESLAAAKESTIALLSYNSDTVEKDLEAAKGRMTGAFKDSYSQLINGVVIPGAKKEHISATATVPAGAPVSAAPNHAVVLLFVNQSAVVDKSPPADSVSSVRVTLEKIDGRWLISGFDPV